MDTPWLEGLAVALYERLGFEPSEPVPTYLLARRWFGPDAIVRPTNEMWAPAATFVQHGRRKFALKRTVPMEYAGFLLGHELAHVLLAEEGYDGEDEEACADSLGAALVAPVHAVHRMVADLGRDHEAIAERVAATHTWAALRIAEVLGIPRAVVTPHRVYTRGPEDFVWGADDFVRGLARGRRKGIVTTVLQDDQRRRLVEIGEAPAWNEPE